MPRRKENLEIKTLRLSSGATDALQQFYPNLGYNRVIRMLVDKHIEYMQQQVAKMTSGSIDAALQAAAEQVIKDSAPTEDSA